MPKELFIINLTALIWPGIEEEINGAFNTPEDAERFLKEKYLFKVKFNSDFNNFEVLDRCKITGRCFNAFFYD